MGLANLESPPPDGAAPALASEMKTQRRFFNWPRFLHFYSPDSCWPLLRDQSMLPSQWISKKKEKKRAVPGICSKPKLEKKEGTWTILSLEGSTRQGSEQVPTLENQMLAEKNRL